MSITPNSIFNLEMLDFEDKIKRISRRKKALTNQGREQTKNLSHIWRRRQDLNPGHIGGR